MNITQEELDRMFDRKYSQWQKKANEKVKQAEIKARQQVEKEQEAQRLAKMTENERLQEQVRQANANYEKLQRSMELRAGFLKNKGLVSSSGAKHIEENDSVSFCLAKVKFSFLL